MSSLSFDLSSELNPKIVVFGVGGAGGNAVDNMISSGLKGVHFWAANTDAQALTKSKAPNKIQLGTNSTMGLGAGSNPEIGARAAKESEDHIINALEGCHMAFITAGMGGGTGTGAAPVIAGMAKERGILTVGVVTKPFHFEGARRMKISEMGLDAMSQNIDTIIVIPNQNLFHIANEKTTFADAFLLADKILDSGVRSVTDLITNPGMINLDFADIRTIMSEMGRAMMSTGEAEGENRALKAAEAAISNPLLDSASMRGAKGVLINITGSYNLTLYEVDEAANRIKEEADINANIIFGSAFDSELGDKIRVSVVATGISHESTRTTQDPVPTSVQNTQNDSKYSKPIVVNTQVTSDPRRKEKPMLNKDAVQNNSSQPFIPPQPRKVDGYNDLFMPASQVEQPANDSRSLFGRMSANFSRMTTSDSSIDIPSILRKTENNNTSNKEEK